MAETEIKKINGRTIADIQAREDVNKLNEYAKIYQLELSSYEGDTNDIKLYNAFYDLVSNKLHPDAESMLTNVITFIVPDKTINVKFNEISARIDKGTPIIAWYSYNPDSQLLVLTLNSIYSQTGKIQYINISKEGVYNIATDISKFIGFNNTTEFTPVSDYNPATKKYVDDRFNSLVNGNEVEY